MKGKIIRGVGGFYYVTADDLFTYECKARGVFRNESVKPLVGDNVEIEILSGEEKLANITKVLKRRNALIRPEVANVDQAMIIFAASEPKPNLNLLDRFLLMMRLQDVETVIVFNKKDKVTKSDLDSLYRIYEKSGNRVIFSSALFSEGIEAIMDELKGRTTVLAGPSGVGKSSIMNTVNPDAAMETGDLSRKLKRGKHTTRHSELMMVCRDTFLVDTPGFSSLYVPDIEAGHLKDYYPEFEEYEDECRFAGCLHLKEPGCRVKQAVEEGAISRSRYDNYVYLYDELKDKRRF
ncbi:MAG: ribosome small subunit-dependent GTPase A [Lachnospiraceae bacterium]|nr:ribosome small subunit-dependent GTPase A [Lachnospiraceae bacterium]